MSTSKQKTRLETVDDSTQSHEELFEFARNFAAEADRLQAIVNKRPRQPSGDYLQCPLCQQYLDDDGECPEDCGNIGQWLANYKRAQIVIDENVELQAIIDKVREAFAPVEDWYADEQEDHQDQDLPRMVADAVADLQHDRQDAIEYHNLKSKVSKTADGVCMFGGETVYCDAPNLIPREIGRYRVFVNQSAEATDAPWVLSGPPNVVAVTDCFSTREAAEAVKAKKPV